MSCPTPRDLVQQASKIAFLTKTPTFQSYDAPTKNYGAGKGSFSDTATPQLMYLDAQALMLTSRELPPTAAPQNKDFWGGAKKMMLARSNVVKSYSSVV